MALVKKFMYIPPLRSMAGFLSSFPKKCTERPYSLSTLILISSSPISNMTTNTSAPYVQSEPIPPDFFTNPHSNDAEAEASYSVHRRNLQTALSLPANNRWVADWLFQDAHTPFHRNITLPPEAFEKSLSMDVMHHFFDIKIPACPIMRMRNVGTEKSSSAKFHSKGTDMLLLPVASMNGITVGYSFGTIRTDGPKPVGTHAFCGRFAFEIMREELLVISNGDQPGVPQHVEKLMVIMSFLWTPRAVREHYMILCPMREYSYYNLPNEVLFFTSAEMYKPSKQPVPMDIQALQHLFMENTSPDVIDDMLETSPTSIFSPSTDLPTQEDLADIFELPPTTSDLPWFLDNSGKPQDNVGIPRNPGDMPTSSGAFNMDSLSESLSAIENSLRGDFYGTRQCMDLIHPFSQAHPVKVRGMSSARNVVARISRSDSRQGEYLRQYALRMYLSYVLPIASDLQFLTQSDHRALPSNVNVVAKQVQPVSSTKARKIAPLPIAPSSTESQGKSILADEEERRKEEKREAKRRRNRLSAAKSNEKRRENWQMQQRTLASLRNRVMELKGRKVALTTENQLLKERLTAVSE